MVLPPQGKTTYRSRGEYLLSLVPKNALDSGDEDSDLENEDEETLERRIQELFEEVLEVQPTTEEGDEDYEVIDATDEVSEFILPMDSHHVYSDTELDNLEIHDVVDPVPGPSSVLPPRKGKKQGPVKRARNNIKQKRKKSKAKDPEKIEFRWRRKPFRSAVTLPNSIEPPSVEMGPIHYFKKFFTDDLIHMIAEESNRYSVQKNGNSAQLTSNDIRDFLAVQINMGIIKMKNYRMYWAAKTRCDRVANIMSRNKYSKIRSVLHFANNDEVSDDKYCKVRPLLSYLRERFLIITGIDSKYSVDEMMIAYKGKKAGSRRQFMPKKPVKWGFKVFSRCGVSGIVYDFCLYAGDQTFDGVEFTVKEQGENFSSKCVLALCKTIKNPALSAVFFDNYYSSPRLMYLLRYYYGILSIGTLRSNRLDGADRILKNDRELGKKGRGAFDEVVDNRKKVTVVKWVDTKPITIGSSYIGAQPVTTISRWSSLSRRREPVPCPKIVKEYNSYMGGVDKSDMLTALYKTPLQRFKWYMAIFAHFIDISLNNAWLLYKFDNPESKHTLMDFRLDVADALQLHRRKRRSLTKVSANPCTDIRIDRNDHLFSFGKRGKCRLCHKFQTSVFCLKCDVRLCAIKDRNCFYTYHTVTKLPRRGESLKNATTALDDSSAVSEE